MRTPLFWLDHKPGLAARLLAPLGALYGSASAKRLSQASAKPPVPVICIGNFIAGGAGKTPTALAVADMLLKLGERPVFLSRGYGGALSNGAPVRVDPARHLADEVGDEPLLLARLAPTIVCADRVAGAAACAEAGATVIVMDDGLQNPALAKAFAFAVTDGAVGNGNGLCIPAGPLRAPMEAQWPLASGLVVIGRGASGDELARQAQLRRIDVFRADLVPDAAVIERLKPKRLVAFAGIGRPQKFFDTLEQAGIEVFMQATFPDHHPWKLVEIQQLIVRTQDDDLTLVTTEKDFVRMSPEVRRIALDAGLDVLPVRLSFHDEALLSCRLAAALKTARN